MNELIAFVAPMLVLAGLACGWTAEAVSPAGGFGLRGDMALGLVGSFVLAFVLYGLNWFGGTGLTVTFLIGVVGATFAIVAQRTLCRRPSLAP
jgi:uncharacterized membrane protein YeaQ/YmgE (transglycosylase-associated protein family)